VAAAAENWLRDVLNTALRSGFKEIDAGRVIPDWLAVASEELRKKLAKRKKLAGSISSILAAYQGLAAADRLLVIEALEDQSHLTDLFAGNRPALPLAQLPQDIREPLKEYASRVFEALDDFEIRDRSYAVHDEYGAAACPFCGYEALDSSRVRSMDWDHYLARSLYPFAGADLRNFSPMGDGCNGSFKLSKDVLRSDNGHRRRCFDPYASNPAIIHLITSTLFARGDGNELPMWEITFVGDTDSCASWESVFELKSRWHDQLDRVYSYCLERFIEIYKGTQLTDADMADKLLRLKKAEGQPSKAAGAFLRAAVYDLLADRVQHDSAEGKRMREMLKLAVLPVPHFDDALTGGLHASPRQTRLRALPERFLEAEPEPGIRSSRN